MHNSSSLLSHVRSIWIKILKSGSLEVRMKLSATKPSELAVSVPFNMAAMVAIY